jgi:hypothetical protein
MVSLTRHSRESGKPVLQGSNRWPWTAAFARFRGVTNDHHLLACVPHRRPQGLCRNPNSRNDDDHLMIYDAPLFAFRGKLCASADLRPGRSRLCAARRGRRLHCRVQHRPQRPRVGPQGWAARGSRSTPMAAASPTCIPACTHCRRAGARCAAPPWPSPGTKISVCHGVGGMFAASGTIIMSNEAAKFSLLTQFALITHLMRTTCAHI